MRRDAKLGTLQRRVRELERQLANVTADHQRVTRELESLLASRAWRLTSPLRRGRQIAGVALRATRRRSYDFDCVPTHHVAPGAGAFAFRSTGEDPQFALICKNRGRLPYGWVSITLDLAASATFPTEPILFCDNGTGFDEQRCIRMAPPVDGVISAVAFIERGLRALRFDPGAGAGDFTIANVVFREITSSEALVRRTLEMARSRRWTASDTPRLIRKALSVLRHEGVAGVTQRLRGRTREINQDTYERWTRRHDVLSAHDVRRIERRIESLRYQPKFSVLMPVYNSPPQWLSRAIESVRAQVYDNWELCIADDASTSADTRAMLDHYAKLDERVRVVFRETNGHISEASNSALAICTGEWVALLDHDDELSPHALYMCAEAVNANRDAVVLYSDEDKIDETGNRYDPYFKSDWNPDLFRSHNMVSHLGVYRRSAMNAVGGFRKGFEGSQDYDLALRVTESLADRQIVHIPHVLYHWRSLPGSTALAIGEKSYAVTAAKRALQEHFERLKLNVVLEPAWDGSQYHRVRYSVPQKMPKASILIATRDRVDLLSRAVASISRLSTYPNYEIIIVDNQSTDPDTLAYMSDIAAKGIATVLKYDHPFNYSAINNFAAKHAAGEILVLLNNDIEVITPGWLEELVSQASRPEVGCVGALLYYPDDRIQHAGVVLGVHGVAAHMHRMLRRGSPGYFGRAAVLQSLSAVTAACLAVRRDVYFGVGGLDPALEVAFNDIDFCLRVRDAGYRNIWTPYAELYHFESASRGSDMHPSKRERFNREIAFMLSRWGNALTSDPAYNPNLSLTDEQFALAEESRAEFPWRSLPVVDDDQDGIRKLSHNRSSRAN